MTHSEDLFAEAFAERAGIIEHNAGLPRETAESIARADVTAQLHAAEIRSVVRMYQAKGGYAVKAFLVDVARHRGQPAADRLRADALAKLKVE